MTYEIVIVGAGIAGISAALAAQRSGVKNVLLLERHGAVGGFTLPYHDSPEFADARELVRVAREIRYPMRLRSAVIGFFPGTAEEGHTLYLQTPQGMEQIGARRVLIASGALEMPKEAGQIPGSRPAGVMTPHLAAELVDRGYRLGQRVAAFDTGRMARAAIDKLRQHGHAVTVFAGSSELARVHGVARLEAIEVRQADDDRALRFECDTLLYCRGRYGATFFLKDAPVSRGPDLTLATEPGGYAGIPGVYAAGACTAAGDDDHAKSAEQGIAAMMALLTENG
ncbi:MAG: FAD-dependent oxidoreductase [Paenibacillaceae bacterium]|nr:FAD-dependent oxidoreductase [Paenibacillaceae bacterium]